MSGEQHHTPASPKRPSRRRWFFGGLCFGLMLATVFWLWRYDPALFGLNPTVPKPVRPAVLPPGTIAVQPLAQSWNFDQERVAWEPILPLAQISEAAYHQGDELGLTLKKLGFIRVDEFSVDSMYAFVASNDSTVVVAFRGTNADEVQDWLVDARITRDPVRDGKIHRGFYRSTQGMLERLVTTANEHGGATKQLWVTGHSLGGAMALVFTYNVLLQGNIKPAGVVTFGQPMVVNGGLAQFLNNELRGRYLRFVHGGDLVPRVFPTFSHCGNLVWFINDSYTFSRPQIARAAKAADAEFRLEYRSEPEPLTESEFENLQQRLKGEQPRRRGGDSTRSGIQPAEAPAFLEDHSMRGYIHWIVTLKERESPAKPGAVGPP